MYYKDFESVVKQGDVHNKLNDISVVHIWGPVSLKWVVISITSLGYLRKHDKRCFVLCSWQLEATHAPQIPQQAHILPKHYTRSILVCWGSLETFCNSLISMMKRKQGLIQYIHFGKQTKKAKK